MGPKIPTSSGCSTCGVRWQAVQSNMDNELMSNNTTVSSYSCKQLTKISGSKHPTTEYY